MLVGDTEAERDIRRWPEEGVSVHEDNRGAAGPAQEGWIKGTVGIASGRHNTKAARERAKGRL